MNLWQQLRSNLGGGSSIVPKEKLKASQANLSPFIVGEDEDFINSTSSWFYDGHETVEDKGNVYKKNILSGAHTTYSMSGGSGVNVFGHNSLLKPNSDEQNYFQGVYIFGGYGKTIRLEHTSETINSPFSFAGIHLYGRRGEVYGGDSFTENFQKEDARHIIRNSGVLAMGRQGVFSGLNSGVLLEGDDAIHETVNRGVIITGAYQTQGTYTSIQETTNIIKTSNNGGGIRILGQRKEQIEGKNEYSYKNSSIECSTLKEIPTILDGNIKLGESCNLSDVDGKEIIKNGKWIL